MYNSPDYNENGNLIPPSGALLRNLKELHNYKYSMKHKHHGFVSFIEDILTILIFNLYTVAYTSNISEWRFFTNFRFIDFKIDFSNIL